MPTFATKQAAAAPQPIAADFALPPGSYRVYLHSNGDEKTIILVPHEGVNKPCWAYYAKGPDPDSVPNDGWKRKKIGARTKAFESEMLKRLFPKGKIELVSQNMLAM